MKHILGIGIINTLQFDMDKVSILNTEQVLL